MAIGVPRNTKKDAVRIRGDFRVELSYPEKRPIEDILLTPKAEFQALTEGQAISRLYFAENLSALSSLAADSSIAGKVRLIYIDPPYATQTLFHSRQLTHAYEDVFEQSQYIDFIRERLIFLHKVLAEDGSIYIHIDDKMLFHVKLLLDEVFGPENYRNLIVRKKCNPKNYTRKTYGNVADYILFYTKSNQYVWNRQHEPWTVESAREYQYIEQETGRKFMKVPVHAPGTRNGDTGKEWRGMPPPPGKHWQYTPSTLDEMDKRGEIFWSKNGNPRRKVYLDESQGTSLQDIWTEFRDAHNQNVQITGYPTEKNIDLLKRIIQASSNPGDLVLDCFAGSGTTLVAAEILQRNWVGIDNSPEAMRTILHRFSHGTQIMGDFVRPKNTAADRPTLFEVLAEEEPQPFLPMIIKNFTVLTTMEKVTLVQSMLAMAKVS